MRVAHPFKGGVQAKGSSVPKGRLNHSHRYRSANLWQPSGGCGPADQADRSYGCQARRASVRVVVSTPAGSQKLAGGHRPPERSPITRASRSDATLGVVARMGPRLERRGVAPLPGCSELGPRYRGSAITRLISGNPVGGCGPGSSGRSIRPIALIAAKRARQPVRVVVSTPVGSQKLAEGRPTPGTIPNNQSIAQRCHAGVPLQPLDVAAASA